MSSSDDEVGSDDVPLVPSTVVDDVECAMGIWRQFLSSFQGSQVLLDPCLCPIVSQRRRSANARVHVLSEGICSTESDTESVACELRTRRRRLSLVWDADSVTKQKLCHHDERLVRVPVDAGRG